MTDVVLTQYGLAGVVVFIVLKECFGMVRFFGSKKNGRPKCVFEGVTQAFCDERTRRIEGKIKGVSEILEAKMDGLHAEIATGFNKLNGD